MPSFASGGQGALFKKTAREASGPLQKFFIRFRLVFLVHCDFL
jgi:hypothetical protein